MLIWKIGQIYQPIDWGWFQNWWLDKNDDSYLFSPTANIQEIRILLARKMTALLLGTSLVTQKKDMIEKIKKNILITKQVQNNDNNI